MRNFRALQVVEKRDPFEFRADPVFACGFPNMAMVRFEVESHLDANPAAIGRFLAGKGGKS